MTGKQKSSKAAGAVAAAASKLICPKCKGTKVIPHPPRGHDIPHASIFEATYTSHVCEDCGYAGSFFPEVQKRITKKS